MALPPWLAAVRLPRDGRGFYESMYVKANHPTRRLGLWLKFNLLEPTGRREDLVGELWGVFLDGETGRHVVGKTLAPAAAVEAETGALRLRLGDGLLELDGATLRERARVEDGGHVLAWELALTPTSPPAVLFPYRKLYEIGFPKKKIVTPIPTGTLTGFLEVDGVRHDLEGWHGFHGHNWGREHAKTYAYGNASFPDGAFVDGFSARIRLGPVTSPWLSLLVVRLPHGQELRFDKPAHWMSGAAAVDATSWTLELPGADGMVATLSMRTRPEDMVGLRYHYPDGRVGHCLNTKFAACTLRVDRRGAKLWEGGTDRAELETFFPDAPDGYVFHGD